MQEKAPSMVVVYNVRKYVKGKNNLRTSSEVYAHLERIVQQALDKAAVTAQLNHRATVMGRDLEGIDV